jgi:hypothetical protein
MVLDLLLALWPHGAMAGMQGRSHRLLMVCAITHLDGFERFVATPDRHSSVAFAATLAGTVPA